MRNVNWLVQKIFYLHKSISLNKLVIKPNESKIYDVRYMQQQHANMCLDASENMVNAFFKKPIQQLEHNPRSMFEAKNEDDTNFNEQLLDIDMLKSNLDTKGPFILSIPIRYGFQHAITCIGYTKNHIIYHDPLTHGNCCISLKELKRVAGKHPASEDPLTINYYRYASEIELTKLQRPVGSKEKINSVAPSNSKFFSNNSGSLDAKNSLINFLEDYTRGNKFFKLLHQQMDNIKQCLQKLKKTPNSNPEQLMQIVQEDLSKLLKTNKSHHQVRINK
jgi:hypothetical protein